MCNNQCNCCKNLVKSTSLVLSAGKTLTVNIPTPATIENGKEFCLVICQSIPTVATTEQVVLRWANGTIVNLNSLSGNYVRADQLKCRKRYKIKFGSDPVHYSLVCPIKCSSKTYTLASINNIVATKGIIATTVSESSAE